MSGKRIGERLSSVAGLSGHDIEEILSEQNATRKRFGEIALQLGLCMPQHVWKAWCDQLAESPQKIDLDEFGVDSQAVALLPAELAVRYHVIPVRALGDQMVLAVDQAAYPQITTEMLSILNGKARFVLSTHRQIARAIRTYYPRTAAA